MSENMKPLMARSGQTVENYRKEYGDVLGDVLYWAWHRNPKKGNIIRAEIEKLRASLAKAGEAAEKAARLQQQAVVAQTRLLSENIRLTREWDEKQERVEALEKALLNAQATVRACLEDESMTFEKELEAIINRYSQESGSNTPDFILAQFLASCLAAWNVGVQQRETWYGRDARPSGGNGPSPQATPEPCQDCNQEKCVCVGECPCGGPADHPGNCLGSKPQATAGKGPCLDPEKMLGYSDQFGGTDFPEGRGEGA